MNGSASISYATIESLIVNEGTGNDVFQVVSYAFGTPVTVVGGGGSDTLVGPNATNAWVIGGTNAGVLDGKITFSAIANLIGGTGVDTFKFSPSGGVASINGGGAPAGQGDWLDYSSFSSTSPVSVNLATGSATGVNGGAAGSVSNIQNVLGGAGNDNLIGDAQGNILIGGAGNDTIQGGSGRSLLIGGLGSDTVTGGSGDDILIGGKTSYDASNHTALMAILAEWQSADSYSTRVNDIRTGNAGLNYPFKLAKGSTVLDDNGAPDLLTGGPAATAADLDWFFQFVGDTIQNFETGEQIN